MAKCNARLQKEFMELKNSENVWPFRELEAEENNLLHWTALFLPDKEPYKEGAFRMDIEFPVEYPFKPPKINFRTQIYHPNVDEKGQVCLQIIAVDNWKPAVKVENVIDAMLKIIQEPDVENPLRADLADEFTKDRETFLRNARDFTAQHAEKRPE